MMIFAKKDNVVNFTLSLSRSLLKWDNLEMKYYSLLQNMNSTSLTHLITNIITIHPSTI